MDVRVVDKEEGTLAELISRVLDILRRRWMILVAATAIVFAAGAFYTYSLTPKYLAQARVRIDPSRDPLSVSREGTQAREVSSEAMETEVTAMYSLNLARAVARELNLANDPEYLPDAANREGGSLSTRQARETAVAEVLRERLAVFREGMTYVLSVGIESKDPAKAARIANSFAMNYISGAIGDRTGVAQRQAEWYQQRLAELTAEVRAADAAVAQFRSENGLVTGAGSTVGGSGTVADQRLPALAGTLAGAEADLASARARENAARARVTQGRADSIAEVMASPVIISLQSQRADIVRDQQQVLARYGAEHPETIRVQSQLAAVDGQIREETDRVLRSLASSTQVADSRAGAIENTLGTVEAERAKNTRAAVIVESLEREAEAKRLLFQQLSQQALASNQTARNQMSRASIIDQAQPPRSPSSPNKPLYLAVALALGLAFGAAIVAVQEVLSGGVRTSEDVETQLGLPVLAAVPDVKTANPADMLVDRPTSFFAESFRIARTALLGMPNGSAMQVIAITSAVPGEGKSTTALAFARTMAIAGSRTLLLECDIRRAVIQRMINVPMAPAGLIEYLHGEAGLEDVIVPGDVENLDHFLVMAPHYSSENLFGDGKMAALIEHLRGRYDHIILDLPPLVGLADGRLLAGLADATALVIKWDSTPANVAANALSLLRADGHDAVGVLVTMVASSAEMVGGNYYMKRYSDYYQEGAA